jgi:hypothetical protein
VKLRPEALKVCCSAKAVTEKVEEASKPVNRKFEKTLSATLQPVAPYPVYWVMSPGVQAAGWAREGDPAVSGATMATTAMGEKSFMGEAPEKPGIHLKAL